MAKTLELDGDKYEVKFDAYFPIFYRDEIGEDFFKDETAIHDGDNYAAIRIAYAAVKYANEDFEYSYKDWLQKYDMQSALDFAVDVLGVMWSSLKTNSKSKKK